MNAFILQLLHQQQKGIAVFSETLQILTQSYMGCAYDSYINDLTAFDGNVPSDFEG